MDATNGKDSTACGAMLSVGVAAPRGEGDTGMFGSAMDDRPELGVGSTRGAGMAGEGNGGTVIEQPADAPELNPVEQVMEAR